MPCTWKTFREHQLSFKQALVVRMVLEEVAHNAELWDVQQPCFSLKVCIKL